MLWRSDDRQGISGQSVVVQGSPRSRAEVDTRR